MNITWGAGEPIPEGENRLDVDGHRALLDRLDINHPNIAERLPAMQNVLDRAAMIAAGYPESEVDAALDMLTNPAFHFAQLPLEQQKEASHLAAIQAAHDFITNPAGYLDTDGDPDPMSAFYALGFMSHTRDLPTYALLVLRSHVLDADTARDLAVFAWRVPEWPWGGHNGDLWHEVWRQVGFCSDKEDVTRPTETMTLYRGAVPKFKRGFAWTGDLDKARWFAMRFPKSETFGQGRVYRADVTPDRLYARIIGRGEDEWVINARGLPITTVEVPRA